MLPYGRQNITEADITAVVEVLNSDYLTQGPAVPAFEQAVSKYCGVSYAVAVNSATSALHIACLALGLGPGDYLWTSPITFVASANCALYCGARVDFVDIEPRTFNLCVDQLEQKLIRAEGEGKLPKIVVPVHLCGEPCDMVKIHSLSRRYGFKIIEDASHAIGGKHDGDPIGNCRYSDITIFSFHPVKIITTGEGGMAVTQHEELARKMELLRSHGITREEGMMTHDSDGPWYYQQIDLGYNYRMADIQAALGRSQLGRIDAYVARRNQLANRYRELVSALPLSCQHSLPESCSAYHLFVIRLELDKINRTHREVFQSLRERKIGVNLHYIPVHTQPYYSRMGFHQGDFPEAERYYSEAISLPMYPTLKECEQDAVVDALTQSIRS